MMQFNILLLDYIPTYVADLHKTNNYFEHVDMANMIHGLRVCIIIIIFIIYAS